MTDEINELVTTREQRIALIKVLVDFVDTDDEVFLSQKPYKPIYVIHNDEFVAVIDESGNMVEE